MKIDTKNHLVLFYEDGGLGYNSFLENFISAQWPMKHGGSWWCDYMWGGVSLSSLSVAKKLKKQIKKILVFGFK